MGATRITERLSTRFPRNAGKHRGIADVCSEYKLPGGLEGVF